MSTLLKTFILPLAQSNSRLQLFKMLLLVSPLLAAGVQEVVLRLEDENSSPAVAEQTTSRCCQGNDESAESCTTTQGQGG